METQKSPEQLIDSGLAAFGGDWDLLASHLKYKVRTLRRVRAGEVRMSRFLGEDLEKLASQKAMNETSRLSEDPAVYYAALFDSAVTAMPLAQLSATARRLITLPLTAANVAALEGILAELDRRIRGVNP